MKKLSLVIAVITLFSCATTQKVQQVTKEYTVIESGSQAQNFARTITTTDLMEKVYTLASDEFLGRETGEKGQKIAADYLQNFYINKGIISGHKNKDYFQEIPSSFLPGGLKDTENVVAFIEGYQYPDEVIVISAHYDHLGFHDGLVHNGADDDASGTAAVMEIAAAFRHAQLKGKTPKRSILFLHLTAEEKGLFGSKFYVKKPLFPLENTVANLNIDMVGRVDEAHKKNENYLYLIGADKISQELHDISEAVNHKFLNLDLDYTYNDESDPNRFYYRSDHYNFAKNGIPVIFYFNGVHEDYHKATDTADKINYVLLAKRTKLAFYTAWELANRAERIKSNKK